MQRGVCSANIVVVGSFATNGSFLQKVPWFMFLGGFGQFEAGMSTRFPIAFTDYAPFARESGNGGRKIF